MLSTLGVSLLLACFSLPAAARSKSAPALGRDYASALAAADRFLQAWQSHDQETGMLMLSDAAKQHSSADMLEEFFSAGSAPAYEIGRGRPFRRAHFAFPVALYATDKGHKSIQPRASELRMIKTAKDDWVVDRLP